MSNLPLEVLTMLGQTIMKVVPITIVLAVVFSVLTHFWACNPTGPWWRKRELVTDLCYWFFVPVFARVFRIGLLVIGAGVVFNIREADDLIAFYDNGHGPLSELPLWVQATLFLVLSDFMLYWLHRLFHGGGFWKYHAIHHSSEDLEWISAARFHPVNLLLGTIAVDVILLMAGISPNIMLWVGPFTTFHSAFVHANLNWTLGPFKYVLATPVFHRCTTPRWRSAATLISPAHFRCGTSCSAPSACRRTRFPIITAPMTARSRTRSADSSSIRSANRMAWRGGDGVIHSRIVYQFASHSPASGAGPAAYREGRLVNAPE